VAVHAMVFDRPRAPLRHAELSEPQPGAGEVLLGVAACGVCRTDLHLTRADGHAFLKIAPRVPVVTHVTEYPLEQANEALADLRAGRLEGAAVLRVS
jgi:D-arabinose 1-dehydrogenase-like Zn-dependent alcohol dehydrogenase